jgi:hypothetical protein
MAIFEYTSSERGIPVTDPPYPPCCGHIPEALVWKRKMLVALYCHNPECPNHQGVLCYAGEVAGRWEKFRVKS